MKLSRHVATLLVGLRAVSAGWAATRQYHRDLEGHCDDRYGFLRSYQSGIGEWWCIAAVNGVEDGAKVGFIPCDLEAAPENQLWAACDSQIKSKLDPNQCMTVVSSSENSAGGGTGEGRAVRMRDCGSNRKFNTLVHKSFGRDRSITVKHDRGSCLTNRGNNANRRDTIQTKKEKCPDFSWFWLPDINEDINSYLEFWIDDCYNTGGLAVKDGLFVEGQPLVFSNETLSSWLIDDDGLFHSIHEPDLCMQAGRNVGLKPRLGMKLRLYQCNPPNPLQHFEYDGSLIKLKNSDKFCVSVRGDMYLMDDDPIILDDCSDPDGAAWSGE